MNHLACPTDASSGGRSTPPPWHIDAVGGRSPQQGEAAGIILHPASKWSALKVWGTRLAKRIGTKKATVAVARKLSVILHRMLRDGSEFRWSTKEAQTA